MQNRQVSVENIQKTVADYYKIRISDMHSKKRSRAVARPRQVAMALAKELTQLSLPEIGSNFGGRDHTTVLHACRQIAKLRAKKRLSLAEDVSHLIHEGFVREFVIFDLGGRGKGDLFVAATLVTPKTLTKEQRNYSSNSPRSKITNSRTNPSWIRCETSSAKDHFFLSAKRSGPRSRSPDLFTC